MTKVEVESEDLEWILTMPGWEFNITAINKTEVVRGRLWATLGVTDGMEQVARIAMKRKEMDGGE